jgi:hypothetical protein
LKLKEVKRWFLGRTLISSFSVYGYDGFLPEKPSGCRSISV